ncbi:MAG TPA: ATP-binding protein [Candidatus Saccharimonadales bacterium]|nr:ATP-binding protein [Candidatus Saccharimonadales bacterium]
MHLTIRTRLTLWYFGVLAASFLAFFWICDLGFRRSIETTVNEASRNNLEAVRRVIDKSRPAGTRKLQKELTELSELWANGAIFEVSDIHGNVLFASPPFSAPQSRLPQPPQARVSYLTTNLARLQYRIAQEAILSGEEEFLVNAAVPTEPFDQALDHFRLIEKEFLPLLVLLACLLGYWLAGRALAPVDRIIQSAEDVGVQNLSRRLQVPAARDELRRLTETLNAMLDRIEIAVKRITQFTADASHDLRTPISVIRTDAEIALRRPRTAAEYRESLGRILEVSEGTTGLIESLLTLARADGGNSNLRLAKIDLTPTLEKVALQTSVLAGSKGISFTTALSNEPLWVKADAPAIEKLFLIFLDNAVKYTPPSGFVRLRSHESNGEAVIEIEDTGIGIAPEDQARIFDRFFRVNHARSTSTPGAGLGLSIASWIAAKHNSAIEVDSALGSGSVFRVRLPLLGVSHSDLQEPSPAHFGALSS